MPGTRISVLEEDDSDDPILSVVNIVDVFLVVIAVLLIAVMDNPINPWLSKDAVVITNPGTNQMEIITKKGKELTKYRAAGEIGEGQGARAGTAYRLKDGSMIYVPEDAK